MRVNKQMFIEVCKAGWYTTTNLTTGEKIRHNLMVELITWFVHFEEKIEIITEKKMKRKNGSSKQAKESSFMWFIWKTFDTFWFKRSFENIYD